MKSLLTRLANKMTLAVAATAVALTWGDWKAVALALLWSAWGMFEDVLVLRSNTRVAAEIDALRSDMSDKFIRVQNKLGVKL